MVSGCNRTLLAPRVGHLRSPRIRSFRVKREREIIGSVWQKDGRWRSLRWWKSWGSFRPYRVCSKASGHTESIVPGKSDESVIIQNKNKKQANNLPATIFFTSAYILILRHVTKSHQRCQTSILTAACFPLRSSSPRPPPMPPFTPPTWWFSPIDFSQINTMIPPREIINLTVFSSIIEETNPSFPFDMLIYILTKSLYKHHPSFYYFLMVDHRRCNDSFHVFLNKNLTLYHSLIQLFTLFLLFTAIKPTSKNKFKKKKENFSYKSNCTHALSSFSFFFLFVLLHLR